MKKTGHTTPQIIEKLREADVALGKGQKVPDICKLLEISEQTYYRWLAASAVPLDPLM